MKMHLIGNGPSINLFKNESGIRVGCNFTNADLKPDWTMIADIKPVKKLYEGINLPCPAIITQRAYNFTAEKAVKLPAERMTIKRIVEFVRWDDVDPKWGMNSAQHGVWYGIEEHAPQEVHIWGCDSLWSTNIESSTDNIVSKNLELMNKTKIYLVWREYWNSIFYKYPNIEFVVHGPEKPDLKSADNYSWSKI